MVKWTICILSVPERTQDLTRIQGMLEYQIGERPIQLLVESSPSIIAKKRQNCLESAEGEYISFVDDDDIVAHDFIETIYPLLDGVDYIGFKLQLYESGEKQKITTHSLKYDKWFDDENGFYRNVSHLNPIRTKLASLSSFSGGAGEDFRWAQGVKPQTEHFIDRPMYFYFHSLEHSLSKDTDGDA